MYICISYSWRKGETVTLSRPDTVVYISPWKLARKFLAFSRRVATSRLKVGKRDKSHIANRIGKRRCPVEKIPAEIANLDEFSLARSLDLDLFARLSDDKTRREKRSFFSHWTKILLITQSQILVVTFSATLYRFLIAIIYLGIKIFATSYIKLL